jgi:hypothetical protein
MVKVIRVPKTPRSAYDPERKVSSLLKAHIIQLESARQKKYGGMQSGLMPVKRPRSEGQASAYIAELTQLVHPATESAATDEVPALRPAVRYDPTPVAPVTAPEQSPRRSRKKPAQARAKAAGAGATRRRRATSARARRAKE